jgi:hypothetical protein
VSDACLTDQVFWQIQISSPAAPSRKESPIQCLAARRAAPKTRQLKLGNHNSDDGCCENDALQSPQLLPCVQYKTGQRAEPYLHKRTGKKQQLKYIVSCDGRWKNMGKLLLSKIEASFEFYEAPPASDRIDSGLYFSALTVSPIQAPGWFSIMGFMMRLGLR